MKRSSSLAQYDKLNPIPENLSTGPANDLGESDPNRRIRLKRTLPRKELSESVLNEVIVAGKSEAGKSESVPEVESSDPKVLEDTNASKGKDEGKDDDKPMISSAAGSFSKTDAPCSSFTASLAKFSADTSKTDEAKSSFPGTTSSSSKAGPSLFASAEPIKSPLFGNEGAQLKNLFDSKPLFGSPSTLDVSQGPFCQNESDGEGTVENVEKEVVVDNDDEDGFDNIWLDKAVGFFVNEEMAFRNKGAGVLKVLRKRNGDVKDRVAVFRKRGTKQLLLTAKLADNFIVGDEAKEMGSGMKGVLFSSMMDGEDGPKSTQMILKFKVDANRKAFLNHVKQTKE